MRGNLLFFNKGKRGEDWNYVVGTALLELGCWNCVVKNQSQTFARGIRCKATFVEDILSLRESPKIHQPPINANALGTAVLAGNDVILRHAVANNGNDLAANLTYFFR